MTTTVDDCKTNRADSIGATLDFTHVHVTWTTETVEEYSADIPVEEIAEELDISVDRVKGLVHLRALREEWDDPHTLLPGWEEAERASVMGNERWFGRITKSTPDPAEFEERLPPDPLGLVRDLLVELADPDTPTDQLRVLAQQIQARMPMSEPQHSDAGPVDWEAQAAELDTTHLAVEWITILHEIHKAKVKVDTVAAELDISPAEVRVRAARGDLYAAWPTDMVLVDREECMEGEEVADRRFTTITPITQNRALRLV